MSHHTSIFLRFWSWYKRSTGYEQAMLQRHSGIRIRSTCHLVKEPRGHDLVKEVMQSRGAR
jgi:hypothetical protein